MADSFISEFDQITCLILAGGRGSRMNGEDKGLIDWQDRPIIQHLLGRFSKTFSNIVINANRNHDIYRSYGYPIAPDQINGFAGPLAGIHAGLAVSRTPYIFVTPCDLPFMHAKVAAQLYHHLQNSHADLAVAELNERIEPLVMVFKAKTLIHSIADYLQSNQRRASEWVLQQDHVRVVMNDMENCFININTLQDKEKYTG